MQSPLHSFDLSVQARIVDDGCGVWANEVPLLGYISLRGEPGNAAFVDAASKVLGTTLPIEPCTYAAASGAKIMWLSPDEWMIACPRERLSELLSEFGNALSGIRSQVADNSGGYTQVMVRGRQAAEALTHCTVYDLEHLAQGRIVGTTFGKIVALPAPRRQRLLPPIPAQLCGLCLAIPRACRRTLRLRRRPA